MKAYHLTPEAHIDGIPGSALGLGAVDFGRLTPIMKKALVLFGAIPPAAVPTW
jgi:hypothetical protein